ncbi:leukotriene A-4 hydrolase-like [Styela clava]
MGDYDPTSFSDPRVVEIKKITLDWTVDFDSHTISGNVVLQVEVNVDNAKTLSLDTKNLSISSISTKEGSGLKYSLREPHKAFGSALDISLPAELKKGTTLDIQINYSTSPNAGALQWLKPEQTAGKKQPYLFSQCQAIHARSIVPCQDSPSVKAPYYAKVTVKDPLVALMSAVGTGKQSLGDGRTAYTFEQKVPTSSYLIALVVGQLESRDIGPRSRVWSEAKFVEKAAEEFSQTEDFISAGESLVGPYVWGRYDLLVLPPSFPFGGMENPCLTFVTPTLLAGDKSLANVIAHEIAHSWTGNLVTNKTWEHFWLNEGHTVFLERKIVGRLNDEKTRQFQAINGLKDLHGSIEVFGHDNHLTNLVTTLKDVDPDDSFSSVPYEKGHTLLFYLETLLGGPEQFEPFLLAYINKFKYKSLTTEEWKDFLYEHFKDKKAILDSVDWDAWFNKPGMPPVIPDYDKSLGCACNELADKWAKATDLSGFQSSDIKDFKTWQIIDFLGQLILKDPLTPDHISGMDKLYKFSESGNSEIKFRWLRLGIRAKCESAVSPALDMVTEQGRMKFTRPLYRDLGGWDQSRERAIERFKQNKCYMHSTTSMLVEKDLKI